MKNYVGSLIFWAFLMSSHNIVASEAFTGKDMKGNFVSEKIQKTSKIYVAGHRGLVGSSIIRALKKAGYHNIVTRSFAELDLCNQKAVNDFFAQEKPEYVFLAAAKVGGIIANSTHQADFIYQNLMIATNVIHAAYKYGVKKLLNLGSSCIYPRLALQPIKEEYLLTGALEPTNEAYAVAKITAIKLCRYYNEQYGTNFISAMPTNLYGPHDNYNFETSHVLPALMRKFHLAKLLRAKDFDAIREDIKKYKLGYGFDSVILNSFQDLSLNENINTLEKALARLGVTAQAVTLWGTGVALREFLYVDDLAQALLLLMESYDYKQIGEVVNLGSGTDLTIKDLALIIKKVVGFDGDIVFDATKPDGMPQKKLDVSRINNLGWKATTDMVNGISCAYEAYLRGNSD